MIVYNISQLSNSKKQNISFGRSYGGFKKRKESRSLFGFATDLVDKLVGNQSGFVFQIVGILILTVAVFLAVQGVFSATSVSTKAQAKSYTTNLITNFEAVPVGNNLDNGTKLIEISN